MNGGGGGSRMAVSRVSRSMYDSIEAWRHRAIEPSRHAHIEKTVRSHRVPYNSSLHFIGTLLLFRFLPSREYAKMRLEATMMIVMTPIVEMNSVCHSHMPFPLTGKHIRGGTSDSIHAPPTRSNGSRGCIISNPALKVTCTYSNNNT